MSFNCRICGDQLGGCDGACPTCGCQDPMPYSKELDAWVCKDITTFYFDIPTDNDKDIGL